MQFDIPRNALIVHGDPPPGYATIFKGPDWKFAVGWVQPFKYCILAPINLKQWAVVRKCTKEDAAILYHAVAHEEWKHAEDTVRPPSLRLAPSDDVPGAES